MKQDVADVESMSNEDLEKLTQLPDDDEIVGDDQEALKEIVSEKPEVIAITGDHEVKQEVTTLEVLTKDGKHTIPYDVLRRTREAEAQARKAADEAIAKVRELEGKLQSATKQEAPPQDALLGKLDSLSQDFPELGDVFKSLHGTIASLQTQVEGMNADRMRESDTRAQNEQMRIREVIDRNPTLTLWESEDPNAWERAVQFDSMLRERSEWNGRPYAERFAKAVELTLVDYPEAKRPPNETKIPAPNVKAHKEQGEFDKPISLSDLPGGTPPSDSDFSNLSATQLESMFEKMTDDQVMGLLARVD